MRRHTSRPSTHRSRYPRLGIPTLILGLLVLPAGLAWAIGDVSAPPPPEPLGGLDLEELAATEAAGGEAESEWLFEEGDAQDISLSDQDLEDLVSRVALYPDELLGAVLAASTFPVDIVQASRYLAKLDVDPDLEPDPSWDESIIALLNYPEVLDMMNEDLEWTWDLGEAVIRDQAIVMDSIQVFRQKVQMAGNLESNEQRVVALDDEGITIESADPEIVYVPVYLPSRVVVTYSGSYPYNYWGPYPWYYYSHAPYWTGMHIGAGYAFGIGWGWGGPHRRPVVTHHRVHRDARAPRDARNRNEIRSERQAWRGDRNRGRSGARPRREGRPARDQRMVSDRSGSGERPTSGRAGMARATQRSEPNAARRSIRRSSDGSSYGQRSGRTSAEGYRALRQGKVRSGERSSSRSTSRSRGIFSRGGASRIFGSTGGQRSGRSSTMRRGGRSSSSRMMRSSGGGGRSRMSRGGGGGGRRGGGGRAGGRR